MHKNRRDTGSSNHVRFGWQSNRSLKHSADSMLHSPSHINKRTSPSPSRLHSYKTPEKPKFSVIPPSEIFNPTVISQAYANRCHQIERVCDQLRHKEAEIGQIQKELHRQRDQHNKLSVRLSMLQRNNKNNRRFDIELEMYNLKIAEL
jgi:hypothetical protein